MESVSWFGFDKTIRFFHETCFNATATILSTVAELLLDTWKNDREYRVLHKS